MSRLSPDGGKARGKATELQRALRGRDVAITHGEALDVLVRAVQAVANQLGIGEQYALNAYVQIESLADKYVERHPERVGTQEVRIGSVVGTSAVQVTNGPFEYISIAVLGWGPGGSSARAALTKAQAGELVRALIAAGADIAPGTS